MDQQSIGSAVLQRNEVSSAYTGSGPALEDPRRLQRTLINLLPPAAVTIVVLFWMLGPEFLVNSGKMFLLSAVATAMFVLSLEFILERHAGWRLTKKEFVTDLFYFILGYTAIGWVSSKLAEEPLTAFKASMGITTEWALHLPFVAQVALIIFLIEFGQYWMHRMMHNVHPFWLTHAPHHHITQLNAMKGAVGNPIELFLISLSVVALFDFDKPALFCAFNILAVVSTFAHANVRSDPPLIYSFFFTTIRHHSLHHSVNYDDTRCNYANSLILIDRLFGTYREGESAVVGQDDRKRLTIWEQFMFPWLSWIDALKAKWTKSASAGN